MSGSELIFDIHECIGKGAFGQVYVGFSHHDEKKVAIKVINTKGTSNQNKKKIATEMFKEIEILKTCESPFIVKLCGAFLGPNPVELKNIAFSERKSVEAREDKEVTQQKNTPFAVDLQQRRQELMKQFKRGAKGGRWQRKSPHKYQYAGTVHRTPCTKALQPSRLPLHAPAVVTPERSPQENCKEKRTWIVMEHFDVGSLWDFMHRGRNKTLIMNEQQVASVMRLVLHGLEYLHASKKIHRDLKPPNVLIRTGGVLKLADFGISAQLAHTNEMRKTRLGSPWYMAPEFFPNTQTRKRKPYLYNNPVDIWAAGIMARELCGEPFVYESQRQMLRQIHKDPSPALSVHHPGTGCVYSDHFRSFVAACLTKDPTARPDATSLLQHDVFANLPELEWKDEYTYSCPVLREFIALNSIRDEDQRRALIELKNVKVCPLSSIADINDAVADDWNLISDADVGEGKTIHASAINDTLALEQENNPASSMCIPDTVVFKDNDTNGNGTVIFKSNTDSPTIDMCTVIHKNETDETNDRKYTNDAGAEVAVGTTSSEMDRAYAPTPTADFMSVCDQGLQNLTVTSDLAPQANLISKSGDSVYEPSVLVMDTTTSDCVNKRENSSQATSMDPNYSGNASSTVNNMEL